MVKVPIASVQNKITIVEPPYLRQIEGGFKFPASIAIFIKGNSHVDKKHKTSYHEDHYNSGNLEPVGAEACYCVIRPEGFITFLYEQRVAKEVTLLGLVDITTSQKLAVDAQPYVAVPWSDIIDYKQCKGMFGYNLAINLPNVYITLEAITFSNFPGASDNLDFVKLCERRYEHSGILHTKRLLFMKDYKKPLANYLFQLLQAKEDAGIIQPNRSFKYPFCEKDQITAQYNQNGINYTCPKCGKDLSQKI
ncbi:MAG: hypothetical protein V1934_04155 [Methanobacteriota archaeon]